MFAVHLNLFTARLEGNGQQYNMGTQFRICIHTDKKFYNTKLQNLRDDIKSTKCEREDNLNNDRFQSRAGNVIMGILFVSEHQEHEDNKEGVHLSDLKFKMGSP